MSSFVQEKAFEVGIVEWWCCLNVFAKKVNVRQGTFEYHHAAVAFVYAGWVYSILGFGAFDSVFGYVEYIGCL